MPKLSEITGERHSFIPLPGIGWFSEAANQKGLAQGGIYLLSGQPGGGKTTLALQMAVDVARTGHRVLYVSMEQSPSELKDKIERQIFPYLRQSNDQPDRGSFSLAEGLKQVGERVRQGEVEERIGSNLSIDESVSSMEALPDFLARKVLGFGADYAGTSLVIVDSIQGLGTAPTSSKPYQRLFEFNRWAKEHGITVILIGHITKGGAIAGPRSLEHNVDCVLYLRKAMKLRPLFVPKNRFGPERHEPLTLLMNDLGCLEKSKHVKAKASLAYGYLPGASGDLIEVQALVKLPKYGDKPGIKAPYLPRQKLTQLVSIVGGIEDIDISDLTFEINCAIPGGRPYFQTLDLPLVMSMLASYFQRAIPIGSLFVGEVDLFQQIRPLTGAVAQQLVQLLADNEHLPIGDVYLSEPDASPVRELMTQERINAKVHGVSDLTALVGAIWPDIVERVS